MMRPLSSIVIHQCGVVALSGALYVEVAV